MRKYISKPFIKWVGGKGQLLNTFESLLPKDFAKIDNITYIEPFVGGGAMLFFMLQKFPNIRQAVINDINPDLITVYSTVKHTPEALITDLKQIQSEYLAIKAEDKRKAFYLEIRKRFNYGDLSDIENTVYFIFLNRTCFNGLYRVNSKGEFNVPFGKYDNPRICDEETIYADSKLLQRVEILNGDFEETEKYIQPNTFVYFDPPYRPLNSTSSFSSYTKDGFNDSEQIRLKKYFDLLNSKDCLMMLSNSDCRVKNPDDAFFDELYKDYIIERVYASRAINSVPEKRGKVTELLIRNFEDKQSSTAQMQQLTLNT